jgi:hypothetical protein
MQETALSPSLYGVPRELGHRRSDHVQRFVEFVTEYAKSIAISRLGVCFWGFKMPGKLADKTARSHEDCDDWGGESLKGELGTNGACFAPVAPEPHSKVQGKPKIFLKL